MWSVFLVILCQSWPEASVVEWLSWCSIVWVWFLLWYV